MHMCGMYRTAKGGDGMRDETLLRDQIVFAVQCGPFEDIGRRIAEGFLSAMVSPDTIRRLHELAEALDTPISKEQPQ